ncbi:Ohr family peroxiredoxin [Achromobacter sp. SD115]|uniref:Ohr family peroxiredoxin n=1 Tax=Achromobacter sp. SD115 TaxID=2782011 RepID=UPI001A976D45|nr:Ohr family peroxiredoxin [Achromobacter sp. SD115]MBO1016485.1 Ohr family peroxiredoxin [Achromobacter sp. SD115]
MPTRIQKVLLTGKTHTTLARNYASQGGEERLDIRLSTPNNPDLVHAFEDIQPHPTAEQLFAGAWSACYTSALEVIAKQMKVQLPADRAVEVEVDLGMSGSAYLLQARFNVFLPGLDLALAEQIAHSADEICPYSKATRGNIDVSLNVHVS